jgi:hypothetical protein
MIGIETDVSTKYGNRWIDAQYVSPLQIVQWTMASAPNHTVLLTAIKKLTRNGANLSGLEIKGKDPIYLTGPSPWTFSIYLEWKKHGVDWKSLRKFGNGAKLIGDILVFPIKAFA